MSWKTYDENDQSEIAGLLMGRRIVEAHTEPGDSGKGSLILDNGTELFLVGNEGCGGCSNGWYELSAVATVDNIITNVRIENQNDEVYRIFVFADNREINVAQFEGTDNGYYGVGFSINVATS